MKCDLAFLTLFPKTCMLLNSCILLKQGTNKIDNFLKQSSIFNFQDSAKKSRIKRNENLSNLREIQAGLKKEFKELGIKAKKTKEMLIYLGNKDAVLRRRLSRIKRILEQKKALQQSKIKSE